MDKEDSDNVSGAKPNPDEEPSESWDLDSVSHYAKTQHDLIVQGEHTLAPLYWRLGQSLHFARKLVPRGHWGGYLEELGVHKVRASKARAIYRTFSTPDAVTGMAIEEAYDQRVRRTAVAENRRRPSKTREECEPDEWVKLETFLLEVCDRAEGLVDVAAFATQDRRTDLFSVFRLAMERLRNLGRLLGAEDEQRNEPRSDRKPHAPNEEVHDDTKKE